MVLSCMWTTGFNCRGQTGWSTMWKYCLWDWAVSATPPTEEVFWGIDEMFQQRTTCLGVLTQCFHPNLLIFCAKFMSIYSVYYIMFHDKCFITVDSILRHNFKIKNKIKVQQRTLISQKSHEPPEVPQTHWWFQTHQWKPLCFSTVGSRELC